MANQVIVFSLFQNDKFIGKGTLQELSDILGIKKSALQGIRKRLKAGAKSSKGYKLVEEESRTKIGSEYAFYKGEEMLYIGKAEDFSKEFGIGIEVVKNAIYRPKRSCSIQAVRLD